VAAVALMESNLIRLRQGLQFVQTLPQLSCEAVGDEYLPEVGERIGLQSSRQRTHKIVLENPDKSQSLLQKEGCRYCFEIPVQ